MVSILLALLIHWRLERFPRATGADKVLVFDHNVRSSPLAERGANNARKPVKHVHNDYTVKSGPQPPLSWLSRALRYEIPKA